MAPPPRVHPMMFVAPFLAIAVASPVPQPPLDQDVPVRISSVKIAPGPTDSGPGDLHAALPRLIALMRAGIGVKEPNSSWVARHGDRSAFDGSYDWHSCVIAHFALLTQARLDGDEELAAFVLDRLGAEALRAEAALLEQRSVKRTITFPYDEAWFLVLLAELARHDGSDAQAVREVRLSVESRLLGHLEATDFPDGFRDTAFCGFYRSWLFAYLLVQVSEPISPGARERLADLRAEKLEPARARLRAHTTSHDWDFLWLPAILALVDRTDEREDQPPYDAGSAGELPEGVTIATVHQLGVFLSRLWPCAYDGARGDAEAWGRFQLGTRALLEREELWAENFAACSHWVPQYIWLGHWFARLGD